MQEKNKKNKTSLLRLVRYFSGVILLLGIGFLFQFTNVCRATIYVSNCCYVSSTTTADDGTTVTTTVDLIAGGFNLSTIDDAQDIANSTTAGAVDIINSSGVDGLDSALDDAVDNSSEGHAVSGGNGSYTCENGLNIWYGSDDTDSPDSDDTIPPGTDPPGSDDPTPPGPNPGPDPNPTGFNCTNAPTGPVGGVCPGDDTATMTYDLSWECVGTADKCTSRWCEYYCPTGFIKINNACVLETIGECEADTEKTVACSAPEETKLCEEGNPENLRAEGTLWKWDCVGNSGTATCQAKKECPWIETNQ